jgi:hypothetical protein
MATKQRKTQPTIFKYLEPTERKCSHTKKVQFKELRSLEEWGEELKSQSKDLNLIIYEDGVGYKNGIPVVNETKTETKIQEHKPCIKEERKPKVAEPKRKIQLAEPVRTQIEDTIIEYKNLEHIGKTKVIIAKTLHYDYFNIPTEWEAYDICIINRHLYYKGVYVDCKAPNQPQDRRKPLEVWVDFKVEDYSYYFPTM